MAIYWTGTTMKITVKVGRIETIPSSYNLFLDNGLRLMTEQLTFKTKQEKEEILQKFNEFTKALSKAGFTVEGDVK